MPIAGRTTMDFFESQATARTRTAYLVFLFAVAVLLTIAGIYLAVLIAWQSSRWWRPDILLGTTSAVALVILCGTAYKMDDLKKGGARVAELLGGVQVSPYSKEPKEQLLLNVVQEMSIASGVPVPGVYILPDEDGINAFAAGFTPQDAVVAVTQGSLETLTRDELQGVVAHEFSHILNGDMRLNMKLMGTVHGLLFLAIAGREIRDMTSSRHGHHKSRSKGVEAFLLFAFLLMIVGYIGVFFSKLIKSAVSREREFLADAAAVQFTRNPAGIAGALKKIARWPTGTLVASSRAEEASHMFFGAALKDSFLRLFNSHPPLPERIKRIMMAYPEMTDAEQKAVAAAEKEREKASDEASLVSDERVQSLVGPSGIDPGRLLDSVGKTQAVHVAYTQQMTAIIPPPVIEATRNPLGAKALVFCLLLCEKEHTGEKSDDWEATLDNAVREEIARLRPFVSAFGSEHRLSLVDMSWPALKALSKAQYQAFRTDLLRLIEADRNVDLFECTVRNLLTSRLDVIFGLSKPRKIIYTNVDQVQMEVFELLSILAREGNKTEPIAVNAFQKAMNRLYGGKQMSLLAKEKCRVALLDKTLARLSETSFELRKQILNACMICIGADRWITEEEAELFRAIAENLDCPVPPLVPGALTSTA